MRDRVELVWTGQEVMDSESCDANIVVRELFSTANTSVLISSFALEGEKARTLFQVLTNRMAAIVASRSVCLINEKFTACKNSANIPGASQQVIG